MFQVGDLVTGTINNGYGITNRDALCIVLEVYRSSIKVEVVAHRYGRDCEDTVNSEEFEYCTYDEFMERYPNAILVSDYSAEELREIKNNGKNEEEKKMELRMDKAKLGTYVLTDEERETLRTEITTLLEEYDYNPTEYAVNKILDEWVKNKGWMINLFKQHPNYNGKFQIVFDSDYTRCCDKNELYNFAVWMYCEAKKYLVVPYQIGKFSYEEVCIIHENLKYVCSYADNIFNYGYENISINGRDIFELQKERDRWYEKYREYRTSEDVYLSGGYAYDKKLYRIYNNVYAFQDYLKNYTEYLATEEFAEKVNSWFPSIKAVAGQKVSRIVNKICKLIGLDKHPDYNREFAKYSDAINPLVIKRHTILSCHPVDYLTMSFGNSWASCHTIDKQNKRDMPNDYSGCYSSGTLSYMLDESSFVYYTVDKDYNGNELELQDKINRNMFHMGEDKLIQARVYPQTTDGETGIYRQIREIAQKVISDCLGVPNMWKNVKGTSECGSMIYSYGTHYRDYTSFSDCNVSYLKGETDEVNKNYINVGHNPICPNCGKEHNYQEAIECEECYNDEKKCYHCGDSYAPENMHLIDGEWYCEDCCFYCDYHEEWEVGDEDDYYYISGYGRVCEEAYDNNDIFYRCEYCDEYHCTDSYHDAHIETEDGTHYCCEDCAKRDGYMETENGEWYPEDEVYYCEHCECYVHESDWNEELECCTSCEDEVSVENAVTEEIEEELEREAV